MKKKYFKITIAFILLFNTNYSFSEYNYTYIICADKEKNWFWLNDLKLNGTWKNKFVQNKLLIQHFILEEGLKQYKLLQQECKNRFGSHFIYPQPAINMFSNWYVFMDKDGNAFPGHRQYFYIK